MKLRIPRTIAIAIIGIILTTPWTTMFAKRLIDSNADNATSVTDTLPLSKIDTLAFNTPNRLLAILLTTGFDAAVIMSI
jgi:hypothetical protein